MVLEILEGDNKFPLRVEKTPVPEGVPDKVMVESEATSTDYAQDKVISEAYGFPGDGKEIEKGASTSSLFERSMKDLKSFLGNKVLKGTESPDPSQAMEFDPSERAATKMNKLIQDQLIESSALRHLEDAAFENVLFGTGILKGPLTTMREIPNWEFDEFEQRMVYRPIKRLAPTVKWVSKWNFYPDPTARTVDDCEYIIERHLVTPSSRS